MLFNCIGLFVSYLLCSSRSLCIQVPYVFSSWKYSMYIFPPQACVGDEPALSSVPHCELCLCLQIHKPRLSRLLFQDAFVCSAYNQVKCPPQALSGVFFLCCVSPKTGKRSESLTGSSSILDAKLQSRYGALGSDAGPKGRAKERACFARRATK